MSHVNIYSPFSLAWQVWRQIICSVPRTG